MTSVIILSILCVLLFLVLIVVSILLYMSIRSMFNLEGQNREYEDFIAKITSILDEDVSFLRGSLAQKLSMDIPEVQELYRGLTRFQDDIARVKETALRMESKKNE